MTEQQPRDTPPNGEQPSPGAWSPPDLAKAVQENWQTAVDRWGDAFIAFASLRLPELAGPEVFETFENSYVGSFESYDAIIEEHLETMGWRSAMSEVRVTLGIPTAVLDWDRPALLKLITEVFDLVEYGNHVYVFAK